MIQRLLLKEPSGAWVDPNNVILDPLLSSIRSCDEKCGEIFGRIQLLGGSQIGIQDFSIELEKLKSRIQVLSKKLLLFQQIEINDLDRRALVALLVEVADAVCDLKNTSSNPYLFDAGDLVYVKEILLKLNEAIGEVPEELNLTRTPELAQAVRSQPQFDAFCLSLKQFYEEITFHPTLLISYSSDDCELAKLLIDLLKIAIKNVISIDDFGPMAGRNLNNFISEFRQADFILVIGSFSYGRNATRKGALGLKSQAMAVQERFLSNSEHVISLIVEGTLESSLPTHMAHSGSGYLMPQSAEEFFPAVFQIIERVYYRRGVEKRLAELRKNLLPHTPSIRARKAFLSEYHPDRSELEAIELYRRENLERADPLKQVPFQAELLTELRERLIGLDVRFLAIFSECSVPDSVKASLIDHCLVSNSITAEGIRKSIPELDESLPPRIEMLCQDALKSKGETCEVRYGRWIFHIPELKAREMLSIDERGEEVKGNERGQSLISSVDGFDYKVTGSHPEPLYDSAASLFAQKLDLSQAVMAPSILLRVIYRNKSKEVQVTKSAERDFTPLDFSEQLATHCHLRFLISAIGINRFQMNWEGWVSFFNNRRESFNSREVAKRLVNLIKALDNKYQPELIQRTFSENSEESILSLIEATIVQSNSLENWNFTLDWIQSSLDEDRSFLTKQKLLSPNNLSLLNICQLPAIKIAREIQKIARNENWCEKLIGYPRGCNDVHLERIKLAQELATDSYYLWKVTSEILELNSSLIKHFRSLKSLLNLAKVIKTVVYEHPAEKPTLETLSRLKNNYLELLNRIDKREFVSLFVASVATGQTEGTVQNFTSNVGMSSVRLIGTNNGKAFQYPLMVRRSEETFPLLHQSVLYTFENLIAQCSLADLTPIQSPLLFFVEWLQLVDHVANMYYFNLPLNFPANYLEHMFRVTALAADRNLTLKRFFEQAIPETYDHYFSQEILSRSTPEEKMALLSQKKITPTQVEREKINSRSEIKTFVESVRQFLSSTDVTATIQKLCGSPLKNNPLIKIIDLCCEFSFEVTLPSDPIILERAIQLHRPKWISLALRSGASAKKAYRLVAANLSHLGSSKVCIAMLDSLKGHINFNQPVYKGLPIIFELIKCSYFDDELIAYLKSRKVNLDYYEPGQGTALDRTIEEGSVSAFKLLIARGAGAQVNPSNALRFATLHCKEVLKLLFKNCPEAEWLHAMGSIMIQPLVSGKHHHFSNLVDPLRNSIPLNEDGSFKEIFEAIDKPEFLFHCERAPYGRRRVYKIDFQGVSFHLKEKPEMPGWEYAVGALHQLLIGHGTALTEVILKETAALQISKTIEGTNLRTFLQSATTEALNKMDIELLHDMVLTSFLTNPEDDFADNFIIRERGNKYELVNIDADHVFTDALQNNGTSSTLGIKSVLYCFDQMMERVDPVTAEKFLKIDPKELLTQWLNRLCDKQKRLYEIFDVATRNQLWTNTETGLSIIIPPNTIPRMYQTLITLQRYLKEPATRPIDLLIHFHPVLGVRCLKELKTPRNPLVRSNAMWGKPVKRTFFEKFACLFGSAAPQVDRRTTSSKMILSFLDKHQTDMIENVGEYSPENALKQLEAIDFQVKSGEKTIEHSLVLLKNGQTKALYELKTDDLFGELLYKMNFSDPWARKIEAEIIQTLFKKNLAKLTLKNSHIKDEELIKIFSLSPGLIYCDLTGCGELTNHVLSYIPKGCLKQIILPSQLTPQTFKAPILESFEMSGFTGSILAFETPQLKRLILRDSAKLSNIELGQAQIDHLDVRGSTQLQRDPFVNFLKKQAHLRSVLLDERAHLASPTINRVLEQCGVLALHAFEKRKISTELHDLYISIYSDPSKSKLDLSSNGLTDEILSELALSIDRLENLTEINLSDNRLTGRSLSEFFKALSPKFQKITSIRLDGNRIDEEAASAIANLIQVNQQTIKELTLSDCQLSDPAGSILFDCLTNLFSIEILDVSCNRLRGAAVRNLFEKMGRCISLKAVNISEMHFSSSFFRSDLHAFFTKALLHIERLIALKCSTDDESIIGQLFHSLPNLTYFESETRGSTLYQSALQSWLVGDKDNLDTRRLEYLRLTGPLKLPNEMRFSRTLKLLHLTAIQFSTDAIRSIKELETLVELSIDRTALTKSDALALVESVASSANLRVFHLNHTDLSGPPIEAFSRIKPLTIRDLSFSNAALSKEDLPFLCQSISKMRLRRVNLSSNHLTSLEQIADSPALNSVRELLLSQNKLQLKGITSLEGKLPFLKSLDLSDLICSLTEEGQLAKLLCSFPMLKSLNLSRISISESGLKEIIRSLGSSDHIQLQELSLCQIFSSAARLEESMHEWSQMSELIKLRLSYNSVTENWIEFFFKEILKLPKLKEIELDFCSIGDREATALAAALKEEFNAKKSLRRLSLKGNSFTNRGVAELIGSLIEASKLETLLVTSGAFSQFPIPKDCHFKVLCL